MHFVRLQLFPPATLEPNMRGHFELNSFFALALFTISGLHLDQCNCVSRSCNMLSIESGRFRLQFCYPSIRTDQNTGLSVPIDFSDAAAAKPSEIAICSPLRFQSNTTGGGDYRTDIECWENLICGRSNPMTLMPCATQFQQQLYSQSL